MLKKEFEERIGRSVTDEEFVDANAMYMAAGDGIDKDVFCKEWKRIGDSPLVKGLFETAHQDGLELMKRTNELKECRDIIGDAAKTMLLIGNKMEHTEPAREDLEREARTLFGHCEVIKMKVRMGLSMSQGDLKYIEEHLK